MGIVLFFAHYGRYTGSKLYDDFAGELLDEIYEDIHADTPINFESGLCGIGWGVEYLLRNGFMEGDPDEVLEDIDKKIMERDIRRITDQSFREVMKGIPYYICTRVNSPSRNGRKAPFDAAYLKDWASVKQLVEIPDENRILSAVLESQPAGDDFLSWELGLENGCAGYGLNKIIDSQKT